MANSIMVSAVASSAARHRALISPTIDTACIGGLSIVAAVGLVFFGRVPFDEHVPPMLPYLLTAGVTWPHFLSSYRLLYGSRETIGAHRVASLYFPIALAAYCVFAMSRAPATLIHVHWLALGASLYLARHYTGQTWGMMASFSHIAGVPFAAQERRWCQTGLNLMMVWQIVWAAARSLEGVLPSLVPAARYLDARIDALAGASFVLGLAGLVSMARRVRALPPVRVLVPWLALYGWYALLRRDATSLVVVQSAHALQYLIFPLRIEETRRTRVAAPVESRRALGWIVGLIALGLALFAGVPRLFRLCYSDAGGAGDLAISFLSVFVSFVNIHHYFIDGCLYKLRNPAVRRDLFAHLHSS